MSEKKNLPNFARVPARQLTLERRVEALSEMNNHLLQLIVAHFPAAKQDAAKIDQVMSQRLAQIDSAEGDLVLRGHGPRGVLESIKLQTKGDNDKFIEKLTKPAEEPLEAGVLFETLARYLQADGQQGRAWVLPEENMYGQLIKDGNKVAQSDLFELADGIYVVKNEQQAFYTLKITLEDGVLIFSPSNGPSLLTYSALERRWIQHTAWQYANGPKAVAAIEKFFSASNVNDVSDGELAKLYNTLRKMPAAKLEGLAVVTESGIDLVLNPIFKISFPNEGSPSIVGSRDDISWNDVTLFTRRNMFREAKARVDKANADGAPKAVAKKAAKKTSAKK